MRGKYPWTWEEPKLPNTETVGVRDKVMETRGKAHLCLPESREKKEGGKVCLSRACPH